MVRPGIHAWPPIWGIGFLPHTCGAQGHRALQHIFTDSRSWSTLIRTLVVVEIPDADAQPHLHHIMMFPIDVLRSTHHGLPQWLNFQEENKHVSSERHVSIRWIVLQHSRNCRLCSSPRQKPAVLEQVSFFCNMERAVAAAPMSCSTSNKKRTVMIPCFRHILPAHIMVNAGPSAPPPEAGCPATGPGVSMVCYIPC